MAEPEKQQKITVAHSTRMADPAVPQDVMEGKRFVDPETGRPASILDILTSAGVIKPAPDEPGPAKG